MNSLYPICNGCRTYHHPHDPCFYIKAQVPKETTLEEVKKMLKEDKILNVQQWLGKLKSKLKHQRRQVR